MNRLDSPRRAARLTSRNPESSVMRTILASTLLAAILVTPGLAQANVEAAPAAAAPATDSAMAAFKKQHDAVIELIDKSASADKVQALVDALLDYDWIADAALSEKKCEDRCDQFEELLT